MRKIAIDTQATGLDPLSGHRIVEIGAVELVDHSAGPHVLGQSTDAVDHDDMVGAGGMMRAVMTLAELQTAADEVSPDYDRHNDNGVRADRIDNVWGESAHGRSARL